MDIRQLETFLRIVDTGSFGAAAQTLNATQSTVSARIRELERSLGVDLFDRSQHRARLTSKGEDLVTSAREIVALASRVRHRIGDKDALTGTVRLGVVGLVAITWLPRLMGALRERYPNLAIVLEMGLTATLVEKLRNGDLDLVLVTGPVVESGLTAISLGFDEFVWMCSPALAVPARTLTPAELATWPVLGLSSQSHHYPVIERWFRDADADYRPVISCNNVRVLAELTVTGLGVSLLPRASYQAEIAAAKLRVIDTAPRIAPVEFVALHRQTSTDPVVAAVASLAGATSEFGAPSLFPI
jgi:DNA-binding transcriptional LysR family regulator